MFDLLITNARIVDGTGLPWYHGDVGIQGDRITAVGKLTGGQARQKIDAEKALNAYKRLSDLRELDPTALEAIENDEAKRAKWQELVTRYLSEAASGEGSFQSSLYASAADVAYRYGGPEARAEAFENVEKALAVDRKNRRATALPNGRNPIAFMARWVASP